MLTWRFSTNLEHEKYFNFQSSDTELSAKKFPLPQRPGSPNPKPATKHHKKGFDFHMTSTEGSTTSQSSSCGNTPLSSDVSIDNVVSNMVDGIITDVFQTISPNAEKMVEFKFNVQEQQPHALAPKEANGHHRTRTPSPVRNHKALCATELIPAGAMSFKRPIEIDNNDNNADSTPSVTPYSSHNRDKKNRLLPPACENKFKCSPFSDYSEVPSGPRPKRGSMPDVTHRKLVSTKSSPTHHVLPKRRMSDNLLAIPDEFQFSGSPFVKAEFLQNQRNMAEVCCITF